MIHVEWGPAAPPWPCWSSKPFGSFLFPAHRIELLVAFRLFPAFDDGLCFSLCDGEPEPHELFIVERIASIASRGSRLSVKCRAI